MRGLEQIIKGDTALQQLQFKKDVRAEAERLLANEGFVRVPKESGVNVLLLTVVHDLGKKIMTCTASFPYIEVIDDTALINLRNLLGNEFSRVTEPAKEGDISPVWGEYTKTPDEGGEDDGMLTLRLPSELEDTVTEPTRIIT
jgi:hypothetical protein